MVISDLPLVSGTSVEPKASVGPFTVAWRGSVVPIGIPGRAAGTVPTTG